MVAAFGIGAGWEALDRAISFSTSRVAFGGSLSENRAYTHKLIVPHVVRLEAGRAFLEETAERIDAGETDLYIESAIAKYVATEAGNLAADAAIQALGGYGYSRESMVEKIRRDLRITTIYEGTSELLEMTIARGRWKDHLRSGGRHYHEEARRLQSLAAARPESGAGVAALALRALAGVLETARLERLTRHPHILLRLGELIAWSECAAALARRAVRLADGAENPKAELRFRESAAAALSRVFAREIVQRVASDGTRWVVGAGGLAAAERGVLQIALDSDLIRETQTGLVPEMDYLADVLYERV